MTIEEAIKTAIEFEKKVHALYQAAVDGAGDATAKKVFATLAEEEQGHVAYLQSRLAEWQKDGRLAPEKLRTILPSAERIRAGVGRMTAGVSKRGAGQSAELSSLHQALAAEDETSAFYLQMVRELPVEGQRLFARFLEIEEGHGAIVRAEIDSVKHLGFWFDLKEFDLEVG
jgi:rubrerythrin